MRAENTAGLPAAAVRPDLTALAAVLASPPVTRYAPSPTGYLHLGHVVNAIYVWGIARALGGTVRLRIEDHDRIRSRPDYESALLEDLEWLGFVPDVGRRPVARQSDHEARYRDALERLRTTNHVYACACSRKDIGGYRYPNTCRHRGLREAAGAGLRVAMVDDPYGDLLLRDRDGHWTYQFAVVVDDMVEGITLVVRGADLASSTDRQVQLARMLGRSHPPVFVHHPLLLKPSGEKLSKSSGDTGVRELRATGASAALLIGHAAAGVGLVPSARPVSAAEVSHLFA